MFILLSKYVKPLEEVDRVLDAHRAFLDKYYGLGKFVCSGRRNPRVGGVILCNGTDIEEVEAILHEDPFFKEGVSEYEIIEFIPTKFGKGLEDLLS